MKKSFNLIILVLLLTYGSFAQVGINENNSNPDASAMLDVQSTDKGVLVPRLTTDQRELISSPANGLLVFDVSSQSFWFYSSGSWTELVDRDNASWKQNGTNIYYNDGKTGIGTSGPSDRLQVDAGAAEPALRVRQNGATKLRIHSNGGTSIGVNSTPPVDGLLVTGEIKPNGNIVTNQNLRIESNGPGTSVELKTNPNNLFLDENGMFGFSQDLLIMETGVANNTIEMNSQGLINTTSEDIVLETTNNNGAVIIRIGGNEITIEENGGIIINSSGNDLEINTGGGNLTFNSGIGDINFTGNNMEFIASGMFDASSNGAMVLKSTGSTLNLQSQNAMNLNAVNSSFTVQTGTDLNLEAGLTLDLDGTNLMQLNAPIINLNNGGLGAARLFDITVGNQVSQTIQSSSSSVLIGN